MQPTLQPIEPCGAIGKCMAHPSSYASHLSIYSSGNPVAVAKRALDELEAARAKDVAAHERNLPLIEINKALHQQVVALMDAIGMPKRWSERDRNSRSMRPKTISHDAGYLTDLRREVKIDDGFASATHSYERMLESYRAYEAQAKREAEQKAQAAERAQQAATERRKADMQLATVLLRYEMPIESTWRDVLDALTSRDQRLDLAVAMSQTRGDWSEGPYRVRSALGRFKVETTEDKDIANDLLACLEDFEDGRVFRDTTWNYSRLFAGAADQQLSADVQLALQHAGED